MAEPRSPAFEVSAGKGPEEASGNTVSKIKKEKGTGTGTGDVLSPGFRCAAAVAGWDYESLLLAARFEEGGGGETEEIVSADFSETPMPCPPPASSPCEGLRRRRARVERKRDARTPKQAVTPLSAGRRNRRPKRQGVSGFSPELLPLANLNLNQELDNTAEETPGTSETSVRNPMQTHALDNQRSEAQGENRDEGEARIPEAPAIIHSPLPTYKPVNEQENEGKLLSQSQTSSVAEEKNKPSFVSSLSSEKSSNPDCISQLSQSQTSVAEEKKPSVVSSSSSEKGSKPDCIGQLQDELSCAICLDICFEPSTTACGHSFCRECLLTVVQKCSHRCPKCRQPLKGEQLKTYPVNVVLWNTIQILFPNECSARAETMKQKQQVTEKKKVSESNQAYSLHRLSSSSSSSLSASVLRPHVFGLSRSRGRYDRRPFNPPAMAQSRPRQVISSDVNRSNTGIEELSNDLRASREASGIRSLQRRPLLTQEQLDAAFAMRLQEEELSSVSGRDQSSPLSITGTSLVSRTLRARGIRPSSHLIS